MLHKPVFNMEHDFDPKSCRHSLGGLTIVFHCHHYASLYTQLADDCTLTDATAILRNSAASAFYAFLHAYYERHGLADIDSRVAIAEQYFAASGLGQLRVICAGPEFGEVVMPSSHIDQAWVMKWGKRDRPVNYIGQGFVAAMFAAVFGSEPAAYAVTETSSIVSGAEQSHMNVTVH